MNHERKPRVTNDYDETSGRSQKCRCVDVFNRIASWDAVQGQRKVKSFATVAGQLKAIDFVDCSGCAEFDDFAAPQSRFSWHPGWGLETPILLSNELQRSDKSQDVLRRSAVLYS
jgi:hypothetical protein